jgi:hypothetical protein
MAKYNEILTGRYNRFIQKLFAMKGPAPAPQLSSDIAMQMSLFNGVENRYLEAWNRFGVSFGVAAAAGISSSMRVRNPLGSNVVAVIEKATVIFSAADTVALSGQHVLSADLVVFSPVQANFDPRGGGSTGTVNPTLIVSTSDATHPGGSLGVRLTGGGSAGSSTYDFITTSDQQLPVLPGDVLEMFVSTANTFARFSWLWRERFLEDSERT